MNFFENKSRLIILCIVALVIILGSFGVIFNNLKSESAVVWLESDLPKSEAKQEQNKDIKIVYVEGAVKKPGVYKFKGDKRVYDALDKAGGTLDFADKSKLNLARVLKDGDRIIVPQLRFPATQESDFASPTHYNQTTDINPNKKITSGKININIASKSDLEKIPNIGSVTAGRIIEYRNQYGRFASPEDLLSIKGINRSKLEKIRPYIDL